MSRKIIDLSVLCSNQTKGVTTTLQQDPPVYMGQKCHAYDLSINSHTGTYFETSSHVFRDGMNTDQFPLEKLILPAFCLKIEKSDPCIYAADLEKAGDFVQPASALLIDTGRDSTKYFSRDAAQWMAKKKIYLMGSNTTRYDKGFVNPTGFFVDLFKADIPIIANITNLNLLPPKSFTLIVLPLNISNVCIVPARVVALIE